MRAGAGGPRCLTCGRAAAARGRIPGSRCNRKLKHERSQSSNKPAPPPSRYTPGKGRRRGGGQEYIIPPRPGSFLLLPQPPFSCKRGFPPSRTHTPTYSPPAPRPAIPGGSPVRDTLPCLGAARPGMAGTPAAARGPAPSLVRVTSTAFRTALSERRPPPRGSPGPAKPPPQVVPSADLARSVPAGGAGRGAAAVPGM